MTDKIDSIKHKEAKRVAIPSKEEAGYEYANEKVKEGKNVLELPVNPVVTRGQDPELFWMNKYGNDDREELLRVDIRSLYRHEHIAPEQLIKNLYRVVDDGGSQGDLFANVNELFGNTLERDELDKVSDFYSHQDGWTNRLIQGDSHLVMASLLEREGMAGQVQMIYIDPPYGIKYGSNWQIKLNDKTVTDGKDEHLTGEPEVIKAFRDTWELGIHSYLSYIRDRLLIAKELLTESGSCFVQISDENVHLVRNVMDEVFGSENFVSHIVYKTSVGLGSKFIDGVFDNVLWYAKSFDAAKYRQLYKVLTRGEEGATRYNYVELPTGATRILTSEEKDDPSLVPPGSRFFTDQGLTSRTGTESTRKAFTFDGRSYVPTVGGWRTSVEGLERLASKGRILTAGKTLRFKKYFDDFGAVAITNFWSDIGGGIQSRSDPKVYVVQTTNEIIKRCVLMTTDPGDLVLDPTCGSGTTAFVAEQFGRRWITIDTSRIALNIAKSRLMTATYPYYELYSDNDVEYAPDKKGKLKAKITPKSEQPHDIRQGFVYEKVPHITLKSLANNEPPATETLYDKPIEDKKKMRVAGPFTVETLQNFEPVSPEELAEENFVHGESFEDVIKSHLIATGIKNGRTDEHTMFSQIEMRGTENLHGYGFYQNGVGEKKVYFHIGPKFGTVSKKAVNAAIRECQQRGDAHWLVIMGFSFESDIEGDVKETSMGNFVVTRCRIHDDLLQEGLKKKPARSAASFVTIGEPEIILGTRTPSSASLQRISNAKVGDEVYVEIKGLDIYDPIKDIVKARDLSDIAYWMVDDDYDGSNFVVRQVFFCGGDKKEFEKWKKGLDKVAEDATRRRAERTLKIEIDEEAFSALYGHTSHPIKIKHAGQKIAVRVISQYGEESMKVLTA